MPSSKYLHDLASVTCFRDCKYNVRTIVFDSTISLIQAVLYLKSWLYSGRLFYNEFLLPRTQAFQ